MQLQEIETQVLSLIGYDRYSSLSVDTNPEKQEDFANLHRCVWQAREEIKINTLIPSLLKLTTLTTVANQKAYSLPSDFDITYKVRYRTASDEWELDQVYSENLLDKVGKTTDTGSPAWYRIFGNSANLIQLELYKIPDTAGESADIEYKPILSNITVATSFDVIMAKYGNTVIKFATAYAFQLLKKDNASFDKWYLLGSADFKKINNREIGNDYSYEEKPDSIIKKRRLARFTK